MFVWEGFPEFEKNGTIQDKSMKLKLNQGDKLPTSIPNCFSNLYGDADMIKSAITKVQCKKLFVLPVTVFRAFYPNLGSR